MTDARADALAGVLRDLTATVRRGDARDRALVVAVVVTVLVAVGVVMGPAWGVAVLFAVTSLLLLQVAVRQRLPDLPVADARVGSTVAADPAPFAHAGSGRSVVEGVRIAMERPVPLEREIVRIYPAGAFGPAAGVLFGLRIMNHGPRSTFRARIRPLGPFGATGEAGFDIAWSDTPATDAEIRRGHARLLRVAACYQDGPRRVLRFFSPAVRSHRRDGAGPRSWSVGTDHELPPDAGQLRFAVSILDEDAREVAAGRFSFAWDDLASDDDLRLPALRSL